MKNFKYILTHSSGNLTVEHNPVNWDAFNIVFSRSKKYHSVLRSQVIEVEFPRDGRQYLNSKFANYGIDAEIGCEIQYLNKADFSYDTLLTGVIDLSEYVRRRDTVTVKIMDSSVVAKLMARDEVEVPINRTDDLDGNTLSSYSYTDTIKVDPVDIWEQILVLFKKTTVTSLNSSSAMSETVYIEEIDYDEANRKYVNTSGGNEEIYYTVNSCVLAWTLTLGSGGNITMNVIIDENGTSRTIVTQTFGTPYLVTSDSKTGSYSNTITLPNGGYIGDIRLEITSIDVTGGVSVNPSLNSEFKLFKITPGVSATNETGIMIHELGAKLLEIITGQSDPLNSSAIGRTDSAPRSYVSDGAYSLVGVMSGNMLRGFDLADRPLVTSFADYFKSIDAVYNLGLWYNGTDFEIKAKANYYRTDKIIDLGEVEDLEISVSRDDYFNVVKLGYRDKLDYEKVNGSQNFNVEARWSTGIKFIQNEKDLTSVYHADDYGIELSRKNGFKNGYSEDTRYDDQIFFLHSKRASGAYETVPGSDFYEVVSVYSPDTRLNIQLSPARSLARHSNQLGIPNYVMENDLAYLSKQFELPLASQKVMGGNTYVENLGKSYASLGEPLYYPEIYNFNAPLEFSDILQLLSDPHGYVEFKYLGTTYSGWILEVSTKPFRRQGNWTLIKRNPNR